MLTEEMIVEGGGNPIIKICPRCLYPFECKVNDIEHCKCKTVIINNEAADYIKKNYTNCLCTECLLKLNALEEIPG